MAAEAIYDGIREAGLEVQLGHIKDVKPENVTPSDLIIIGSPTHAGDMSKEMKDFVGGLKKLSLKGKKGSAFDTRYIGEEVGALAAIEGSMRGLGVDVVIPGLPIGVEGAEGPIAEGELPKCEEFGRAMAGKLK